MVIMAATIVILYSSFGGVRAVTFTDVLQFVTFIVFMLTLVYIAWNHLPHAEEQVATVLATKTSDLQKMMSSGSISPTFLFLLFYNINPSLGPAMFQRVLMAYDTEQARQAFTFAACIHTLIISLLAWLAILLLATNPNLQSSNLTLYVIDHYVYVGFKGLTVVGIAALAMSTADSELNACAVLAAHDLLKPLFPSWKVSITAARVCAVLIGTASLCLALHEGDILSLLLNTASFYMPIVTVPLLMAILGFRSSPRAALIGMLACASTVWGWD